MPYFLVSDIGKGPVSLNFQLIGEVQMALGRSNWGIKIPEWISKASECMRCLRPLGQKINCRNCGKLVCKNCSTHLRLIPRLGYTKDKVKVCSFCADILPRDPPLYF